MRRASIKRVTKETDIALRLVLDGKGRYNVSTGIRFLDHMLELFARHGGFDLKVRAAGDLDVDQHHTVEDLGIALGEAVSSALGNRKGINRAGYFVMPMDETLAVAAIDLSGRIHAVVDLRVKVRLVGDLQTELVHDFFEGFAQGARANVHVKVLYGRSSHHHIEAAFKAFARALRVACSRDRQMARMLPSTKGCCDRTHRLRRRKPDVGAEGVCRYRRGTVHARGIQPSWTGERDRGAGCRALRRDGDACGPVDDSNQAGARGTRAAVRDLPRHAVAVRRQRRSAGIAGLGALAGVCSRLPATVKVPHVGWNSLDAPRPSRLLEGIKPASQVYFTHSFAAPVTAESVAVCAHGAEFAAAVEKDHVFGVQFHPEKSSDAGLQILRNFSRPRPVLNDAVEETDRVPRRSQRLRGEGRQLRGAAAGGRSGGAGAPLQRRRHRRGGRPRRDRHARGTARVRGDDAAVSRELFIPLTVGGGIRTEADAAAALDAGADKVGVNSAALAEPALLTRLAARYGSQAVVVAIDAKRNGRRFDVFARSGSASTGREAVEWAKEAEAAALAKCC